MNRSTPLRLLAGCALVAVSACRGPAPAPTEPASPTPYRAGALTEVRLTDEFWRPRLERNRTVTIPHIFRENRETGRMANFERAAGRAAGAYGGADDGVELTLPMPARRVAAHPKVKADAGRLALQRGPLVYAVEGVDHGGSLAGLRLDPTGEVAAQWRPDLLGGVVTLVAPAQPAGPTGRLLAVPYFAWANRGPGEMAVWLPVSAAAGPDS